MTLTEQLDAIQYKKDQSVWLPASNGAETPFRTRTGRTLLYCWQPATGKHAYLDCGSDIILTQEEADAALAL